MSFRIKLFLTFALSIGTAVALVSWTVSINVRHRFAQLEEQRTQALIAQFRREFAWRSSDVERRVEGIAHAESIARLGVEMNRPDTDFSLWVSEAPSLAQTQDLDFLELVTDDGTIISSAHWPARFGYRNEWISRWDPRKDLHAFLEPIELPEEVALGIIAVRAVQAGQKRLFVIGGLRLDKDFLFTLALPEGIRVLLYRNLETGFSAQWLAGPAGAVPHAEILEPMIRAVQGEKKELKRNIAWTSDPADSETVEAIPLFGRENRLLGILLVGNSRREMVALTSYIRKLALIVGTGGVAVGLMLAWWVSLQISRPVLELADGARKVAAGNWQTRVEIARGDEIGRLAGAFNEMTRQLIDQRERLVQSERVAAWRELARRLAHELKNPLFPLQITVENLKRARHQHPEQFDEVFDESTGTLLTELGALRAIVSRFSEFAKMPPPQLESVDLNQIVERVLRLFEPQFQAVGNRQYRLQVELDSKLSRIQADPEQLARALQNLVLNALDAMPEGGTLTLRTLQRDGSVLLEVADSGCGLTKDECERLFTPYYTTKLQGTGLGLAIVQSVVSDHGGRISVDSTPGHGTTFHIELPERMQG